LVAIRRVLLSWLLGEAELWLPDVEVPDNGVLSVTTSEICLPSAGSAEESREIRREVPLDLDDWVGLDCAVEEDSAREKAEVGVILWDLGVWELLFREFVLVAE
jgi:hypothetical protein